MQQSMQSQDSSESDSDEQQVTDSSSSQPQAITPMPLGTVPVTPQVRQTQGSNYRQYIGLPLYRRDGGKFLHACKQCLHNDVQDFLSPQWGFHVARQFGGHDHIQRHWTCIHYVVGVHAKMDKKGEDSSGCTKTLEVLAKHSQITGIDVLDLPLLDGPYSNPMSMALFGYRDLKLSQKLLDLGAKAKPELRIENHDTFTYCIQGYWPKEDLVRKKPDLVVVFKEFCDWQMKNKMFHQNDWEKVMHRRGRREAEDPFWAKFRQFMGMPAKDHDIPHLQNEEL